ncbi:TolC family protein [Sorangium sp. So ce1128]
MTLDAPRFHAAVLLLALAGSGCVASNAGIAAARDTVHRRSGLRVAGDESADAARARKEILSRPLTADAAARLALLNSPEVQAALAEVGVARAGLVAAVRLPNPEAELAANFHSNEDSVDLELDATIDVLDLLLIPLRASAASDDLDAAALEAASEVLGIAFRAKVAFFEYQAAEQMLELRKTVLYATSQSADLAGKLLEAGNVPELDALTERALFEESRIALTRAEEHARAARERVNIALGLHGKEAAAWRVSGRLADPDAFEAPQLEPRALEASLRLSALRKRYAASAGRANLGWTNGLLPRIGAGFGAEREDGEWGYGPRVAISVPLFYQGQGAVAAADAARAAAESRHAAVATTVRATARSLTFRLRAARESALFYKRTLLPLRDRIVEETLRQYNAMNLPPFQVLSAKRDQVEAAEDYVELVREYWITRAQTELLMAGGLPDMRDEPLPVEGSGGGADEETMDEEGR